MKRLLTSIDFKNKELLKEFLDSKAEQFESPAFIEEDPISIPHRFSKKEDQEIAGLLAATIAWGQRVTILKNADSLMERMDNAPHEFVLGASQKDFKKLEGFVHRTFNAVDLFYFIESLQNVYKHLGGLENVFAAGFRENESAKGAIGAFREAFFQIGDPGRTGKHVANPNKGSSAKRLNMYLRWMTRPAQKGVDLGIWDTIPLSKLMVPLDVHTGNVARQLGLLSRKQNDWTAVELLMEELRKLDPNDPVKYDFALFGLGVYESE